MKQKLAELIGDPVSASVSGSAQPAAGENAAVLIPEKQKIKDHVFPSFPKVGEHSPERSPNAAITPTEHSNHRFLGKRVKETLQRHKGVINLVLMGDSILSHIQRDEVFWGQFDYQYNAMNLGSPGDRTEHVLYRLQNDEYVDALKNAKLVVIMIGTNNIGIGDSADSGTCLYIQIYSFYAVNQRK